MKSFTRNQARRGGCNSGRARRASDHVKAAQIERLRAEGLSWRAVGAQLGMHHTSCIRLMNRFRERIARSQVPNLHLKEGGLRESQRSALVWTAGRLTAHTIQNDVLAWAKMPQERDAIKRRYIRAYRMLGGRRCFYFKRVGREVVREVKVRSLYGRSRESFQQEVGHTEEFRVDMWTGEILTGVPSP